MKRIALLLLSVIVLSCGEPVDQTRPNIVLIFIDDLGYGDIGRYGATDYSTPVIDRLATEGMMFTHFYSAQAVCSASRAGLLTGNYPNRMGISGAYNHNARVGLNPDELTIAELLKEAGYATGIFGKWHLGHHPEFLPLQHGFDEFVGLPYSNDMWPVDYDGKPHEGRKANYPKLPLIEGNETIRYIETLQDQDELTTLYTERAVDFINRNKENPFFLYLPHSMVHVPLGVSDKFRGKSKQGLYGDVMMELDWSMNEVLQALEKNGISENTIVIFTSDNGPWLNYGNHAGSTNGLREGKGTSWEGGQREPCLIRWPAVIAPGILTSKMGATIDILPTIAEITGTTLPSHSIDGVSLLPLLQGDPDANPRDHLYYYYNKNDLEAVRKDNWKLVLPHSYRSYEEVAPKNDGWPGPYRRGTTEMALYDLRRDPGERYNLVNEHPVVVADIMELVERAREELGDNLTNRVGSGVRPIGRLDPIAAKRTLKEPHQAIDAEVTYGSAYSTVYPAGGKKALVDGKLASAEDHQSFWQAWQGDDLSLSVDLGKSVEISEISISFLQNPGSWIFLPETVAYEVSTDGQNFRQIGSFEHKTKEGEAAITIAEDKLEWKGSGRYVKITAKNVGQCPEWHLGAGEPAWIFTDEIVIR